MMIILAGIAVLYLGITNKAPRAWYALKSGIYVDGNGNMTTGGNQTTDANGDPIDATIGGGGIT